MKGLIVALPGIISTLVGELPYILQQVWEGISEAFGDIPGIDKVEKFFTKLKDLITENTALIKKSFQPPLVSCLQLSCLTKSKESAVCSAEVAVLAVLAADSFLVWRR